MRRFLVVGALLLVAACGSEASEGPRDPEGAETSAPARASGPEKAVETLMRSLDAGDCAAVRAVVVTPSAVDCDTVGAAKDSFVDEGIDLDEVVYQAGPTQDTSSTVTITWGNDYPDESYDVEKIKGSWRVVFDSVA